MKKNIRNLMLCIKSDNHEALQLAEQIARIPAVEINGVRVWHAPTKESTGEYTSVTFMGLHVEFQWHDHTINIDENNNGKLIVRYDDRKIGEIFWSALWGKLETMPEYTNQKISKAEEYILDCLWKAVYKISPKGRPYGKVALPKPVQYGDCRIWAEGGTIYAELNGEKLRVMGNTWRGMNWTADDVRLVELQKVIKKAFIVY